MPIPSLWLPILVATVLVFAGSNLVWMVFQHHKSDAQRLPDEPATVGVLAKQGLKPGVYRFPWADSMAETKDPAYSKKLEGPVGLLTVVRSGPMNMAKFLSAWIAYVLVISVFVAYLTGRTLTAGTPYLHVFRVAGAVAFLAYAGGHAPDAIWWGKPWKNALKEILDGLFYALLTGGAFGWLWPR